MVSQVCVDGCIDDGKLEKPYSELAQQLTVTNCLAHVVYSFCGGLVILAAG